MFKLIFIKILLFSYCFCEISVEKKEKLLNGLINICNNLPDRQFTCDEGFIKDAQELDGNIYNVEAHIRADNKLLRCKAALQDSDNEVISLVNNDLHCEEINDSVNHEQPLESQGQNPVPQDQNTEEQAQNVESETQLPESGVQSSDLETQNPEAQNSGPQIHIPEAKAQNEPVVQNAEIDGQNPNPIGQNPVPDVQSLESPVSTAKPGRRNSVELDSEVQSDPGLTSGEQFIAVPRDHPTPCAGCASHVNVDAPGVADLASLGIQHLDFHDPNTKHDLDSIVQVERQVQVVNGVRYILTLAVHFNKCTVILTPTCSYSTACKISILVKPWAKLPSGAPYRSILSNNCTEIWHYGDDGEVLPDNNVPKGDIKVIQHTELQSQPKHEKHLTDEEIKSIEEQIIPNSYFDKPTGNTNEAIRVDDQDVSKEHVFKVQASKQTENSISGSEQRKPVVTTSNLSQDKKKLIDDMLDFFKFSGCEPKSVIEPNSNTRNKRSYDNDLQVLSIAEKYNSIKNSINNAKFLFEMAQNMVDYLNEMDMDIKNRELRNVLTASEETDNEQHFLYIQANVIIPCSKSKCELQDGQPKICNGVIDITNKMLPQILNTFCYDENKQVEFTDKINQISPDDPVIQKLVREAVKQIEYESTSKHALQYNTILSANTQTQSGTITKISIMIDYMDCDKSVPLLMRSNCTVLEQMGHKICEVIVHERHWLKERKISYSCTDRPYDMRMSKLNKNISVDDPKILEMIQEAIQILEIQSNKNNKQKLVGVTSISSQVIAGLLVNIEFTVGYTDCTSNMVRMDLKSCNIMKTQRLRQCKAQIWDRSWIIDGRQVDVSCDDDHENKKNMPEKTSLTAFSEQYKEKPKYQERSKRQTNFAGGEVNQDIEDQKYKSLAEESLRQHVKEKGISEPLTVVKVTKVTTQVVAGSLTRIYFETSNNMECNSKIWEKPWENFKEITVSCENHQERSKRHTLVGGEKNQDIEDQKYKLLAEESLRQHVKEKGISEPLTVVKVTKVTTQVVAGSLTRIYFETSNNMECNSKIWEKPWENFKEITVSCDKHQERSKRHTLVGGEKNQDIEDQKYKLLAEESLRQHVKEKGISEPLTVVKVTKVTTQVVAGSLIRIYFETSNNMECNSKIWEKPWENFKEITVSCENHQERSKRHTLVGGEKNQDIEDQKYKLLAEESLRQHVKEKGISEPLTVVKVTKVTTQVVAGSLIRIYFETSNNMECNSKIWEKPWENFKEITVSCDNPQERFKRHIYSTDQVKQNPDELNNDKKTKVRREVGNEDDDLDEDLTYYYADRAVQYINDHVRSSNLHKLVTVHAVQTAEQMRTTIVRMYIEVAETYCMRNRVSKSEINNCDEMEGINHRLCFARLYPEPEDELVLKHVTVICNDDDGFDAITGISIPELLRMSILYVEREKGQKYKLVHQGEPQVIPSLDSNVPIQIDFILATTNCSKDVNLEKNPFQCFLDTTIPSKSCHSFIWLVAETKTILWISVNCSSTASIGRQRRSSDKGNEINDDTLEIQKLVTAALQKLEMSSMHRYKQRVLQINSHSTKITTGKVTTIDFDVGYTSCLKYEWVDNIATCDFLEHLPRRHCVAQIWERLWLENGRNIDVSCVDDETPLEAHIEFESAEMATQLADRALKHIEAKYPHPQKQKIVRIFSLEKQVVAGIHYRMKVEVGYTDCMALSDQKDCKLLEQYMNKFCRVNVWVRPWTDHPANFRVTCDYQESTTSDLYHQIQAEHLFYAFVSTYNPSYANDYIEMQKRFEIFKNNIKRIQDLNTHERGTASYGVTRFADLTYEEFSTKYLGLKPSLRNENQVPMKKADIPNIAIPESFDWRDFQAVTEVKDQGSCGSCWAFSVTGNIEGQWKMQSGQLVSLSEQELVDCDKLDSGCKGGLPDNAYRAIEAMGGLETETDYPYEGEDDKCVFNKTLSRVKISGAVNITSNETGMAQWLVHNGPISIGINANAMQFYMGGVSHPWKTLCNPTNLDHGVLIVGYGIKNYPIFNKKLPYWIIKNSWGKSWGEQGYYRVFRGDGTCGVNQMASSAII